MYIQYSWHHIHVCMSKVDKTILKIVLFFYSVVFLKRHFLFLAVFRSSRAFSGLFTTRLAKMADAQVCSGTRRGGFKSIFLHVYEHIYMDVLVICPYFVFIHRHARYKYEIRPEYLTFVVDVLHTLV